MSRGKRILLAALNDLWKNRGMNNAKEVVLTGGSGKLCYLFSDYYVH